MEKIDEFIKNPRKSLFILAAPIVISTIVQTLYNIVDTAFVGRLGAEALAGITFSFPLFFILISINAGISSGMISRISRFLGEQKKNEAENAALHGLLLSLVIGIVTTLIGIWLLKPTLLLFGAEDKVLKFSTDYMSVIFLGAVFMFSAYTYVGIFSAQGDTKTPMKIQIIALIVNAILDPIFIFTFGLGTMGAAIATVLSIILTLVLLMYYVRKVSYLHIHLKNFHYSPKLIYEMLKVGFPATLMMIIISVYVIFLNKVMDYFGTNYVAAFGIATRLESVAMLPIVGFSMGLMTLVGMFYGAKRYDLVKDITWYGIKVASLITVIMGTIFFIFPEFFLRIFTEEKILLQIGVPYIRLDVFTFPLMAITMMIARNMQGLGFGMPGLVINVARIFFLAIPLAYLFVYVLNFGYLSVAVAMILGGIVSSIMGILWMGAKFKNLHIFNQKY